MGTKVNDPRKWQWYIVTAALMVAIYFVAPQQLSVVTYKVLLVSLAGVLALTIDRSLYKRWGPLIDGMERSNVGAARVLARALVFLAVVLGVSLGL